MKKKILLLLLLILATFQTNVAFAKFNDGSKIKEYTLEKNESIDDFIEMKIREKSSAMKYTPEVVHTQINHDGRLIPTVSSNKLNENSLLKELIKFEKDEYIINPGETSNINFTIKNADSIAPPGIYNGSITLTYENANNEDQQSISGSGLSFSTRVGYNFRIEIPGKTFTDYTASKVEIVKNPDRIMIQQKFYNNGNSLLKIYGVTEVQNSQGVVIKKIPIKESFLGTKMQYPISQNFIPEKIYEKYKFTNIISIEEYQLENNSYKKIDQLVSSASITIVPWNIIISALSSLFIALTLLLLHFIYKFYYLQSCIHYTAKKNDNVYNVAASHSMRWKKLAKINKLHPPYIIKAGDRLLVRNKKNAKKSA